MRDLKSILICVAIPLAAIPSASAWGFVGHEVVATIAQIHLHPSVFPNMCTALNFTSTDPDVPLCHLAPPATWADRARFKMRWSAPMHYIGAVGDYPRQTCQFPGDHGWVGRKGYNVLEAIRNVTTLLEDWTADSVPSFTDDDTANEAIKFLIHFLGDMHMPLHLTDRDRGGNSDKVMFGNKESNLHSVWDSLLINKAVRVTPRNYSRPLPIPQIEFNLRGTIYDSYVRRIMWEGIMGQWKDEVESWLTCPPPSPAKDLDWSWGQSILSVWNQLSGKEGISIDTDDETICPYHWAKPVHALNCEIVWPAALDEPPYTHARLSDDTDDCHDHDDFALLEDDFASKPRTPKPHPKYLQLDTPEYAGAVEKEFVIEKLLAQGGIRLAGVLNYLFASVEGQSDIRASKLRIVTV